MMPHKTPMFRSNFQLLGGSGAKVAALFRNAKSFARRTVKHLAEDAEHLSPAATEAHLKKIAIHEAGHVVVGNCLGSGLPKRVRISGKRREYQPSPAAPTTAVQLKRHLTILIAGRAAEIAYYGYPSTGATNELRQATSLAFHGQCVWGLGDGNLLHISIDRLMLLDPSTPMGRTLNAQLQQAEMTAIKIINNNRDLVTMVAKALLDKRELTSTDLSNLLDAESQPPSDAVESTNWYFQPKIC